MRETEGDIEILTFGEPLVELIRHDDGDGVPGYRLGFGGDTSNVAIAAARQGADSGVFGAVGADEFGDALAQLWAAEGVDARGVVRCEQVPTGIYFVTPDPIGRRFAYYRSGSAASRVTPEQLDWSLVRAARILHTSAIAQAISEQASATVRHAIDVAKEAGVRVAYDSNLRTALWSLGRARETTHTAMALCDIALPSLDDSRELTGLGEPDAVVDFYLDLGPRVVALKMGAAGAIVATPEAREVVAPLRVEALDGTGAGDTFDGAFLAWLLRGEDPFEAGRMANIAAALSTTGYGALGAIPSRAEVESAAGEGGRLVERGREPLGRAPPRLFARSRQQRVVAHPSTGRPFPFQERPDPPLHLLRVVRGDVCKSMIQEGIVEPFDRGLDVRPRFLLEAVRPEAWDDLDPVDLQKRRSDLRILEDRADCLVLRASAHDPPVRQERVPQIEDM